MACYYPLDAWQLSSGSVVFVERGDVVRSLQLPCGRCIGCRLERSRQWAVRIMHESSLHDVSSFVTLTYDAEHVDPRGSLCYRDYQLFMKRVRKELGPVRFFMCGEYGKENGRPHFHAALFGVWLSDFKYWRKSVSGFKLYRSATLERLWAKGNVEVGSLTFESAAYMARYCVDKVTGDLADEHYRRIDHASGEVFSLVPEFCRMSLRPGIGHGWFRKFGDRVKSFDTVVVNGHEAKPPRYYDKLRDRECPEDMEYARFLRAERAKERAADGSPERLAVRESVDKARLNFKRRII